MTDPAQTARICKALAHPRRVLLFEALARDPALGESYRTLQKSLKMPENSLVHHLDLMERGGLIHRRRDGAEVQVLLTPEALVRTLAATDVTARNAAAPVRPSRRPGPDARPQRRSAAALRGA